MSTKNDLLAVWVKVTGDPLPETRHRIRVLSERGLLPDRAGALTHTHFAHWLLAVTGAAMHKDAPGQVRLLSQFMCTHSMGSETEDIDQGLRNLPLLQAIVAAMKRNLSIVALEVSEPVPSAMLIVQRKTGRGRGPGPWAEYHFSGAVLPIDLYPVFTARRVTHALIDRVLSEITLQDDAPSIAEGAGTPPRAPAP